MSVVDTVSLLREAGGIRRFCGRCGAETQADDKFCQSCGHELGEGGPQTQAPDGPSPRHASGNETPNEGVAPAVRAFLRPVLEAEITPGMEPVGVVALARECEEAGFDRVGISDVILWPDSFMLQALVAAGTERVEIGAMVTNPYSRHPAVLASAVATLDEISGGRAFLGLGVGAGLEAIGIDYPRPVRTLRESITVIRSLLDGEAVGFAGEMMSLEPSRLVRPAGSRLPVVIGTRSPAVMRLAGEVADRVLVGARYLSPELASTYRVWLSEGAERAGRDADLIEVAPRLTLCASEDGEVARASVKRYVAHYVSLLRPVELGLKPGWLDDVDAALDRSKGWYFDHARHDDPELDRLIDDDLVRKFAVAGTPKECAELLGTALDLGFTSLSCNLVAVRRAGNTMKSGLSETISAFAEVFERRGWLTAVR